MSRAMSKFGDYSVHNEWQRHKSQDWFFKQVKKDRKKVAELRKYIATNSIEFVIEKPAESYVYAKEAWAIPTSILGLMRCLGSPNVAIHVSNGDIYQIAFNDMMEKKYRSADPKLNSYSLVKFEEFVFSQGEPESIEKSLMIGKWK